MEDLLQNHIIFDAVISIIITAVASGGFWALLAKRFERRLEKDDMKQNQSDLLRGLAHDRIIYLGMKYIRRGRITHAEFENISEYLFKPYSKMGGNGSAVRIMEEIRKLPIISTPYNIVSDDGEQERSSDNV